MGTIYMTTVVASLNTKIEQQDGKIYSQLSMIGTCKDFKKNWGRFELSGVKKKITENMILEMSSENGTIQF